MKLSIIIVNYNVKEFLQNLIHSIEKAASNISHEIIIVDNASDDGSVDFIREKFPFTKLIVNNKNLGFSKGNNIGIAEAQGEYILFLNPDTLVSEDTFTKMIEFFETHPDAGLAGCKILNSDGTIQLACRRSFPGPWTSFCKVTGLSSIFPKSKLFARYNLTYLDENKTYEVDAVSGSFMMIKKEIYQKIGGFDEQFFMYGEDLDLCYRVQKAGYKVYYVHDSQIIHYKGESTRRSSLDETKFFYNAMHLFVKKHLSSSFIIEIILRSAIGIREFFAFMGRRKLVILFLILDFLIFNLSLFLSEKIYRSFSGWVGFPEETLLIIYTIPALIQIFVAAILGVYKKNTLSVLRSLAGLFAGFIILSSITFFFKQFAYSRAVVIINYVILLFTLTGWRIILKLFFNIGKKDGTSAKRTLIVGVNKQAAQIADKLRAKKNDYHSISGLIGFSHADIGKKIESYEIVGSVDNISKVIEENKINEVIFSSEELSYNKMMSIVSTCQNQNVDFKLTGNNLDFIVGKTSVSILDDLSLIEINYNISNPVLKFIKNLFDYAFGFLVLFFIYPFIYLIVKLTGRTSEFKSFILKVPSIFSGQVSFVGPKIVDTENNLYLGKKGLTGFWYIENNEGEDSEKLDIFYAKNQNVWLDLEILGKTFNKMLNR